MFFNDGVVRQRGAAQGFDGGPLQQALDNTNSAQSRSLQQGTFVVAVSNASCVFQPQGQHNAEARRQVHSRARGQRQGNGR